MIIKIMNKLFQGKENYKNRNAVYRKVRSIKFGIKCLALCSLVSFPFITIIFDIWKRLILNGSIF